MPLAKVYAISLAAVIVLTGCGFFTWWGSEAEGGKEGENVLYYQLSGQPDKGWKLADEDNLKEVEKLIVISSTMLGFRKNLHFDKLVPLETGYLKKDKWNLISFDQREPAAGEEEAEESASVLIIKLEWLNAAGDVERVTVQVVNPSGSPPSRDVFDKLFGLYVAKQAAAERRAGSAEADGADAGKPPEGAAPSAPPGDAGVGPAEGAREVGRAE